MLKALFASVRGPCEADCRPVKRELFLCALLAGCGDGDPLGGAHGGTADPFGPNANNPSGDNGNGNGNGDNTSNDPMADGGSTKTDGGSSTTKDAGQQMQGQDAGMQMQQQQSPTWSQIFSAYLATSTTGNCGHCHSACTTKASSCYTWLQGKGYINGASSSLVDANSSCLSWYGGNMPPSGPSSYAKAKADMDAWAKAGGANN